MINNGNDRGERRKNSKRDNIIFMVVDDIGRIIMVVYEMGAVGPTVTTNKEMMVGDRLFSEY